MVDEREMVVRSGEEYPIASEEVTTQKLPVAILVDTSGSMSADLPSINKAIDKMVDDIRNDNVANKQVEICLISFDDKAHLEQNWKPVSRVEPASFTAGGCTNLEAGLTMALKYSRERSDYYSDMGAEVRMPFLITITDGEANSGDFNAICNEIRQRESANKIRPFTIAVGNYDKETVARLSDKKRVLEFTDPYHHDYMEFFNFMTQSLKALSTSKIGENVDLESNIGNPNAGSGMQVPNLKSWLN